MSKRCELTGISPLKGHNVSHAKNKTKRRFLPNLKKVTFRSDILKKNVKLNVANAALRTVDFKGSLCGFCNWYNFNFICLNQFFRHNFD